MKKFLGAGLVLALVVGAGLAVASPLTGGRDCGERCGKCGHDGRGAGPGSRYDATKTETVKGQVVAVEKVGGRGNAGSGIGLKLKTTSGELVIHLGPQWYLDRQGGAAIAAGDTVEVTGVKTLRRRGEIFIAAEVRKGTDVLKLRDEHGVPLWADGKRCDS
jgi:hypothetical protein